MKHIDLFSGIGGFAIACKWVWGEDYQNIGHSEIEKFPCKVYHKHFPESECLGDITKIKWQEGQAELITGGFPCQPHSIAGKRKGSKDERDLWSECVRALCGVRPRYALFENVPALLTSDNGRFFNRVLADLAKIGYDAEWQIISAASVGAPHLRERIWIIAYPKSIGNNGRGIYKNGEIRERSILSGECDNGNEIRSSTCTDNATTSRNNATDTDEDGWRSRGDSQRSILSGTIAENKIESGGRGSSEVAGSDCIISDSTSERLEGENGEEQEPPECPGYNRNQSWRENWLEVATRLCRMDDGVSYRVDRLKALGNAIVPQVAETILRKIKEFERAK